MTREEAVRYFKRHIDLYCVTGICKEAEEMAIQALEQVSPARPKGYWEKNIDNSRTWDKVRFYCSECGEWQTYGKTYFCPFCGADMRNEQNLEYADNDTAYYGLQSAT